MEYTNNAVNILYGLLIVLGLIYLIAWFAKKIRGIDRFSSKKINILGSTYVGRKEKLMLIQVEKIRLLIGITPKEIQTLLVLNKNEKNFANDLECITKEDFAK